MENKNTKVVLLNYSNNLPVIQYQTNYKQKLLLQYLCDVINNSSVLLNQSVSNNECATKILLFQETVVTS